MIDLVISLVGKTCSGKDTLADYICNKYKLDFIISYTTRAMRDSDVDGVNHYFINDDEMNTLEQKDLLSYTKNEYSGIRYCALRDSSKDSIVVYILNPNAIYWTKNNTSVKVISIYVDTPEGIIKRRALQRGDDISVVLNRLDSEREEFDTYRNTESYDYVVDGRKNLTDLYADLDLIMEDINDKFQIK